MKSFFGVGLLLIGGMFLSGCAGDRDKAPMSILGESPRSHRQPLVDSDLNGLWAIKSAELAGKPLVTAPEFELRITDDRYGAGLSSSYSDRGRLELFGDELAGQARRLDVIVEVGMNEGKRIPALYRMIGRELEIIYDMSGTSRPTDFVSREGTQHFRATYRKKM